jgi:hypothetical protein
MKLLAILSAIFLHSAAFAAQGDQVLRCDVKTEGVDHFEILEGANYYPTYQAVLKVTRDNGAVETSVVRASDAMTGDGLYLAQSGSVNLLLQETKLDQAYFGYVLYVRGDGVRYHETLNCSGGL